MAGEQVQQSKNTPFYQTNAPWLPKKEEEKIVIPFRASDEKTQEAKTAGNNKDFQNYYGLEVEKGLVKKVEYTPGEYSRPEITLNDGAEIHPHKSGHENIKFEGNHPKVYQDKSGYTVFENLKNADISKYGKTNDKYSLKNTHGVSLYTGGGNDTVKVEKVKGSAGFIGFSELYGTQSIIDGAADPKKAPGMSDIMIKKGANNQVFWSEGVQYFDKK